MKHKVLKITAN